MTRSAILRVTCDRCGAEKEFNQTPETKPRRWAALSFGIGTERLPADLCDDCFSALCKFLDGEAAGRPAPPSIKLPPVLVNRQPITEPRRRYSGLDPEDRETLKQMWLDGVLGRKIAAALGIQISAVYYHVRAMRLPRRPPGRPVAVNRLGLPKNYKPSGGTNRRHVSPTSGQSVSLPDNHKAIENSKTLFPKSVINPADSPRLLVGGHNQRKIGKMVKKGKWKGFPIYTLTLEERASCPTSCAVWNDCYGNNMPFARRHSHGPELEDQLRLELEELQAYHPEGFVVRPHILGDFYSAAYVELWSLALKRLPALHIFAFTAHEIDTEIGKALAQLNIEHPLRCRVRFSNTEAGGLGAKVIDRVADAGEAVICPAQTGKTDCCGTCTLCWTMDKPVAFLRHGEAVAAASH